VTDEFLRVIGSHGSIFSIGDAATIEQARRPPWRAPTCVDRRRGHDRAGAPAPLARARSPPALR